MLPLAGKIPVKHRAHRRRRCRPTGEQVGLLSPGFQRRLVLGIGHEIERGFIPYHAGVEAVQIYAL